MAGKYSATAGNFLKTAGNFLETAGNFLETAGKCWRRQGNYPATAWPHGLPERLCGKGCKKNHRIRFNRISFRLFFMSQVTQKYGSPATPAIVFPPATAPFYPGDSCGLPRSFYTLSPQSGGTNYFFLFFNNIYREVS
jgi:hypothetical protein